MQLKGCQLPERREEEEEEEEEEECGVEVVWYIQSLRCSNMLF